jgi:hypothetical protein
LSPDDGDQRVFVIRGSRRFSVGRHTIPRCRRIAGGLFFCDPPNGEIVEHFRQMELETERRMVAVHTIRFSEDEVPTASLAIR